MKTKFFLAITLAILTTTNLLANQNNCPPKDDCECPPCGCDIPPCPTISAYNQSARVNVCGSWDAFVTGSFIYWEALEQGLRLGSFANTDSGATRFERVDMTSDYKAGFKAGIGYNFNYDNWTAYVEYTRFHPTIKFSKDRPSWALSFLSQWHGSVGVLPDTLTSRWKIKYDLLDLELSRYEYRGTKLIFNPFFGLKGGWLDQSFTFTEVNSSDSLTTVVTSDSWLIGPRAGIYSKWLLGCDFSILGKAAGSLLYQKLSNLNSSINSSLGGKITAKANSIHNIAPFAELLLGLNWGSYFGNNNWYFDVFAAYELQYIWDQNYLSSTISGSAIDKSNLYFHGLNITARLDF
ncbi:MAG: hypothetical protein KR126chlam4_00504 [Candidatus Anoxychlamydiales bacterium]|uniref:MOMP-like family protein n=1 Tax=marine sediment metagenome TaxID=412755 RepID=A0A0F9F2L3_9ZZZZ|nr:hypothetical protein [Candidatus Anoxychlamydiales bacterium]NGX40676.1 hypothetical protein [Candidatus Anoxychlamydiales bacterium]HEU64835.1 hypothetical protein [Chlamydiota bacterium]